MLNEIDENKFNFFINSINQISNQNIKLIVREDGSLQRASLFTYIFEKLSGFLGGRDMCKKEIVGMTLLNYLDYAVEENKLKNIKEITSLVKKLIPKENNQLAEENKQLIQELTNNLAQTIHHPKSTFHKDIQQLNKNFFSLEEFKKYEGYVPKLKIIDIAKKNFIFISHKNLIEMLKNKNLEQLTAEAWKENNFSVFKAINDYMPREFEKLLKKQDDQGNTLLHKVLYEKNSDLKFLSLFLSLEIRSVFFIQNDEGKTPLHISVTNDDLANLLLQEIPKKDLPKLSKIPDKEGLMPIYVAIGSGCTKTVKLLLRKDPLCATIRHELGDTPLASAVSTGNVEIVKLLIRMAPQCATIQNKFGTIPLHLALLTGNLEIIKLLLREAPQCATFQNDSGNTPLHIAAAVKCNPNIVKLILDEDPRCAEIKNKLITLLCI